MRICYLTYAPGKHQQYDCDPIDKAYWLAPNGQVVKQNTGHGDVLQLA